MIVRDRDGVDMSYSDEHSRALLLLTSLFCNLLFEYSMIYTNHLHSPTLYLSDSYQYILLGYPIKTHCKSCISDQNYQRYITSPFSSLKSSYFTSSQQSQERYFLDNLWLHVSDLLF